MAKAHICFMPAPLALVVRPFLCRVLEPTPKDLGFALFPSCARLIEQRQRPNPRIVLSRRVVGLLRALV